jgi:hypothetical protein
MRTKVLRVHASIAEALQGDGGTGFRQPLEQPAPENMSLNFYHQAKMMMSNTSMVGCQYRSRKSKMLLAAAALAMFLSVFPAWAALGGGVATVQADQLHMQGTLRKTATASYTVHEIQSTSGIVVREYVASVGESAGKVFAVAWQGPWPPDMVQLLGNYFDQYVQAAKAQSATRRGRRPLVIDEPGLVVQIGGHPRAFMGRAYVPEMLPVGVRAEEIR